MVSKTTRKSQTWSIIIFCFNERDSVQRVFESVFKTMARMAPGKFEIVIVDDGSTDGSAEVIQKIKAKSSKVRVVFHPRNLGIGRALYSGYAHAQNENVCAVPADGQFNPGELIPFRNVPPKTFVSFFRKKQAGYNLFRLFLSAFNRLLNRILLGIHLRDVNWVKIYKLKELRKLNLRLRSSLIESEICAKLLARGNDCREIPSVYHQRRGGEAKGGSLLNVWRAFQETLRLAVIVRGDQGR